MPIILEYCLKVGLGYAVCLFVYRLLYRKDTFFVRNRIYLLLSLILPMVLPFVTFPFDLMGSETVSSINTVGYSVEPSSVVVPQVVDDGVSWSRYIVALYFFGALLVLARAIWGYCSVYKLIKSSQKRRFKDMVLAITMAKHSPFSIFKWIVVSPKYISNSHFDSICEHERIHYRQKHTIDLILTEIVMAFQWFNPFVWLLKRDVTENHEYIVDQVMIGEGRDPQKYQYALLQGVIEQKGFPIANHFNRSLIKNRIYMMNRERSSRVLRLKEVVMIPLVVFLMVGLCSFEANESFNSLQVVQKSDKRQAVEKTQSVELQRQIARNMKYPVEAQKNNIQGEVKVAFRVTKSGEIKDVEIAKKGSKVKTLSSVVVVAYGKKAPKNSSGAKVNNGKISLLEREAVRVIKNLKPLNDSDLKGKRWIIPVEFKLEYPKNENAKSNKSSIKLDDANVMYIVDGIKRSKKYMDKVDPNSIESITVLKGEEAAKKYGEDSFDGVIEVTLKKQESGSSMQSKMEVRMGNKIEKANTLEGVSISSQKYDSIEEKENVERDVANVKIKGSVIKGNPLYVVDGKKISDDSFKKIKPESIASMTVLKDESAIKQYGKDGKNGVIVITLKK